MTPAQLLCLLSSACPGGEYALDPPNCTSCWPCEPGFRCASGSKEACDSSAWSPRGQSKCTPCDELCPRGFLRVRECDPTGDVACAMCPSGFGCSGGPKAELCGVGTYSVDGVCVECEQNRSSNAGASECVCLGTAGCAGCPVGTIAIGMQCRPNPKGYGLIAGELQLCPRNTYSADGHCRPCSPNAWSEPGASSAEECVCKDGYMRSLGECVACESGTVFHDRRCVLCSAGEYCLGRTHHESCPTDMYSHRGAGLCTPCRMNSGCLVRCFDEMNCTCDHGYVDSMGECRRCLPRTMEDDGECVMCPAGYECKGGADVWRCPLTTWSPGNTSSCLGCSRCDEITTSRCNSTHDSVCERTTVPLGVVSVFQQYTIKEVLGEVFGTFALLYVASIPKAQLLRVCDKDQCVQCFQGICPDSFRMRRLYGPGFELAFEVRTFASRMDDNIESMNRPAYLSELAKTTMHKLTDREFLFLSRVEHSTICPVGLVWDGVACNEKRKEKGRSWVGLGLSFLTLIILTLIGWNIRGWVVDCGYNTEEPESVQLVREFEDETSLVSNWGDLR